MQTWTEVQKKKVKKKPTLIFSELPGSTDGWMDGCLAEPVGATECRFLMGWKGDGHARSSGDDHARSSGDDVTPGLSLLLWWVPLS